MYDSFRIKNFKCPLCKKVGEQDFQSKSLDKSLDWYTFPCIIDRKFGRSWDEIEFSPKESKVRKNFSFEIYGTCHFCNEWIQGKGIVKNHVWNEYVFERKDGKKSSHLIPYSQDLYDLLLERRTYKNDSEGYKEALKAFLIAIYRGELTNEEAIVEVDKLLKLDVFKSNHVSATRSEDDSIERMFGYKRTIFDILTKHLKHNKSENPFDLDLSAFDPQGPDE